ncbi:ribonuclease P protein component [Ructibacterium gallinarum]|uniref:Ribonuclease P protein component n=1 Tax=Ructibacterium gallinarum TaxID=2779355 RepID=A0A9D5M407_9FIRM|nr:ribonuclease P protein component [Ructibacterium gallinarum]MBE5040205.1 ribonuclease P protein component [Ructibacterium gallinarum]
MKIISLTQNAQFRRLYRRGKSVVLPTMVVYAAKNREGISRLGITAGKKVGGAVERNRAKRRIREIYRVFAPRLKTGYDFCIVARGFTVTAPHDRLVRDFCGAAEKLGVWEHEMAAD